MSLQGAIMGGIQGAIIGGVYGGWYGAAIGFVVGAVAGGVIASAMAPDIPSFDSPLQALQLTTNEIGLPIPDVLGTAKISGNLLFYGGERSEAVTQETGGGGKGGGDSQTQTTGHRYYMSWAIGICAGPVDAIMTIFRNEDVVWEGNTVRPGSGGEETIVIPDMGSVTFYFGTADQAANANMGELMRGGDPNPPRVVLPGMNIFGGTVEAGDDLIFTLYWSLLPWSFPNYGMVTVRVVGVAGDTAVAGVDYTVIDELNVMMPFNTTSVRFIVSTLINPVASDERFFTAEIVSVVDQDDVPHDIGTATAIGTIRQDIALSLNTPYRGLCWAYFDDCFIGDYNRMPTMRFVLNKKPVPSFFQWPDIQTLDYNPACAIWYILHDLTGLPESWLDEDDFAAMAMTLFWESRGISLLMDSQQSALNYLESINSHIDAIVRYGSDGKFHPKLIRDDYTVGDLPLIDETVVLDDPVFSRKSWIDTINELKVQYTEIPGHGGGGGGGCAIGYTSLQMGFNEQQTLTAPIDAPYEWAITAGGGTLSTNVGGSTIYTAPASNPNCAYNPTITLSAPGGICEDSIQITVGEGSGVAYYIVTCIDNPWCGDLYLHFGTSSCPTIVKREAYNCSGALAATDYNESPHSCTSTYSDEDECYGGGAPGPCDCGLPLCECTRATWAIPAGFPPANGMLCAAAEAANPFDVRTNQMKLDGCCPQTLM